MAKHKPKSAGSRKKAKTTTRKPKELDLPSMPFIEQIMSEMFGGAIADPTFEAQQIAYDAMEAMGKGDEERALELAMQAVEVDPNCLDALHLLSQFSAESDDQMIADLEMIVARGESALGKLFFKENVGYFWGLLETRPYMRVRAHLADLLEQMGRREEAIGHYEEMLRLNPGDNQGLRYVVLGLYLASGRLDAVRRLFEQYQEESAVFAWSRVLERFLTGELEDARNALQAARAENRHVEAYLTGRKRLPAIMPAYYGFGDNNEAVVCAKEIGEAWRANPPAVEWLKNQKTITVPRARAKANNPRGKKGAG